MADSKAASLLRLLGGGLPLVRILPLWLTMATSIGSDVPWHVTQLSPAYQMLDRRPIPATTLQHAQDTGFLAGLQHVYEGNVPRFVAAINGVGMDELYPGDP